MRTRPFAALGASLALLGTLAAAAPARAADDHEMFEKGVVFLVEHANEDGSFGPPPGKEAKKPGEIGITALCLKALAEATIENAGLMKRVHDRVEKGTSWLLLQQQPDGSFTHERGGLTTYRTAMAVMALTAVDKVKHQAAIAKGAKWLSGAQFSEEQKVEKDSPHYGGWGYDKSGEKPDADLSNTQMALEALKAAGVAADDPVMKRAVAFVTRCQNDSETNKGAKLDKPLKAGNDGGFFYGPSRATASQTLIANPDGSVSYESYASMTYAGLVSMAYAGLGKDDGRVKAALGWIKAHYTLEENTGLGVRAKDPKQAQMGLYYYYFTFARALHALGSDEVETASGKRKWARDLLDALKARQKPDGSWSNDADRWMEGVPVLVTAYSINAANLALEHVK